MNLALKPLDVSPVPSGTVVTVVERVGTSARDPTEAVLDEIRARPVARLVICLKRRSPVGKAVLDSISGASCLSHQSRSSQ